jgi:hypothetical protein
VGNTARKARPLPGSPAEPVAEQKGARSHLTLVGAEGDPYWQEVYGEMLRSSLCFFAKEILKLEIGPHLEQWGEMVETRSRVAINAARDHSKSTFFSYAYPIWRAWMHPGCEVYIFSSTLEQAMEFLDVIIYGKDNLRGLLDIPELARMVPHNRRDPRYRMNRRDIRLTNGSRIRAVGFRKKIRGRHPHYIVCDDVLNDEDLFSETIRRKNIEYFNSAIANLVDPNGQIVCVGTPFHAADLWGFLRKNPVYIFRSYPGIIKDKKTGKERALFPWRWTLEKLYNKKLEIGSVAFTREILCQPISDDLSIFPSHLFPPLFDTSLCMRPKPNVLRKLGWSTYMGVDVALSASVGADYFVIFVIGVDAEGQHHLVDIRRRKGWPFRRQLTEIEMWARYYDCSLVFIESNQAQRVWGDEMKRTTDIPVKDFVTTAQNKYPLDKGIPGLRILLENGKMTIPRGDAISIALSDIWIEECISFGFVDGKLQGAGAHDDTVMAWWLASEARKAGGFSFSVGESGEDAAADDEMTGGGDDGESWEEVMMGAEDEETGGYEEDDGAAALMGG